MNTLIGLLHAGEPVAFGAIPWASPVVSFGNPANSKVATLGLNPSNLEFSDGSGNQLQAPYHRFESLTTLQVRDWSEVAAQGIQRVWQACEDYFYRNPYDQWFKRLEKVLVGTGATYYSRIGEQACHLDLVPFATAEKWSSLTAAHRAGLIELGIPSLVRTVKASDIRVLVLNGSTVVREFSRLLNGQVLDSHEMPSWALQGGRVAGVSHVGRVSELNGIALDRELLVLGYNHNIQSSFGVTTDVVSRIATWVARSSAGVIA
ncbi:hypothetical protein ACSFBF_25215 [Variovorax sp. ZT5P49]|uniref:hypothetical protein n=1 Tax=Variovorax sp. ZT5P49 TaxID=3443733 RepID=UPI003F44BA7E